MKKSATLYSPAYVDLDICKERNKIYGDWSLDDKMGWAWYGEDDEFILGILRVGNSSVYDDFQKELEESNITKNELKKAMLHSINKNPKDGLYHLIGDNSAYLDFQGISDSIYEDMEYDVSECLKNNFIPDDKAEEVASELTYNALDEAKPIEKIFEEYEDDLAKNFRDSKSWKEFIKETIEACDTYEKAKDFLDCIVDKVNEEKEEVRKGFWEEVRNSYYESYNLKKEDIKELSKEYDVPEKLIDYCGHGGYDAISV